MRSKIIDMALRHPWLTVGALIAIGAVCSYWFAGIGEPRAVWLWRDILGVLP